MRKSPLFLVPINFSESSYRTVEYGIQLAKQFQSRLRLVHVVNIEDVVESDNQVVVQRHMDYLIDKAESAMGSFREMVSDAFSIPVEIHISIGNVRNTLIDYVQSTLPDLLLIGKRSNESRIVRSIVKQVSTPVIVVPENSIDNVKPPSRIVLATDMKPVQATDFKLLVELARPNNSLSLLHINSGSEGKQELMNDFAKKFSEIVQIHTELICSNAKEIVGGVLHSAGGADLLCTVKRRRSIWNRFVEPAISTQLAALSTIPILVLSEG